MKYKRIEREEKGNVVTQEWVCILETVVEAHKKEKPSDLYNKLMFCIFLQMDKLFTHFFDIYDKTKSIFKKHQFYFDLL